MINLQKALKTHLITTIQNLNVNKIGVCLSGGIDSTTVLLAAIHAKKQVKAYSFTLKGLSLNIDAELAEKTCNVLNIPFECITIPTDLNKTIEYLYYIIGKLNVKRKTNIECTWPMFYICEKIKKDGYFAALGTQADGYFGLDRNAILSNKVKENVANMNKYREEAQVYEERREVRLVDYFMNGKCVAPYDMPEILLPMFKDYSWQDLNIPQQKKVLHSMFQERSLLTINLHSSLQMGNSGVREHFAQLLQSKLNYKNKHVSMVGVYNDIYKETHKIQKGMFTLGELNGTSKKT
jgi:hypothetical protein